MAVQRALGLLPERRLRIAGAGPAGADGLGHRVIQQDGGAGRNRTADKGFADLRLATWRPRRSSSIIASRSRSFLPRLVWRSNAGLRLRLRGVRVSVKMTCDIRETPDLRGMTETTSTLVVDADEYRPDSPTPPEIPICESISTRFSPVIARAHRVVRSSASAPHSSHDSSIDLAPGFAVSARRASARAGGRATLQADSKFERPGE